jgi:RNA polymerase sigma-70 factor (ECF subfamily)
MTTTSITTRESSNRNVKRGNGNDSAEQRALHELYRAHGCMVYARCRRLLRDRALAEDALHETFLRVRPYLTSVGHESELVPLLCRIATNYCLKVLRRRTLQARFLDSDVLHVSSPGHDEALTRFHAKQALEHLPEQTRRVVLLTYAAGMTQDEVARSLGISRRTVVYRLSELRSAGDRSIRRRAG